MSGTISVIQLSQEAFHFEIKMTDVPFSRLESSLPNLNMESNEENRPLEYHRSIPISTSPTSCEVGVPSFTPSWPRGVQPSLRHYEARYRQNNRVFFLS